MRINTLSGSILRRIPLIFLLVAAFSYSFAYSSGGITYPDFTVSMMREGKSIYMFDWTFTRRQKVGDFSNTRYLDMFRTLYAKNILASEKDGNHEGYRIPRIVHQIWLGSSVPEKYAEWMSTWIGWQGWEYKLWTDEDVKGFGLYNQELYDNAANYGEKSDILRLEILDRFGGIYVDVDFECINPQIFDELHKHYDFYIGFEPLEHGLLDNYNMFKECNALLASAPRHPILIELILNLRDNYEKHSHLWTVERTGPAYLSRVTFEYEMRGGHHGYRNMYLPCTFFYPFSEPEILYAAAHDDIALVASPETAAIHYWSHSWCDGNGGGNLYFNRQEHRIMRK